MLMGCLSSGSGSSALGGAGGTGPGGASNSGGTSTSGGSSGSAGQSGGGAGGVAAPPECAPDGTATGDCLDGTYRACLAGRWVDNPNCDVVCAAQGFGRSAGCVGECADLGCFNG